jgi:RNA polymerase sigma-70 factor (ECF subfamily)
MDREDVLRLYDAEAVRLRAWLIGQSGDREVATDLTAETFAQALMAMRRYRGGNERAWLYGIARHLVQSYHRTQIVERRARRRLAMPDRDWGGFDEIDERLSAVSLNGLPAHEREALELHVINDLSYREIATRQGISAGAARMRVFRALARLRGGST